MKRSGLPVLILVLCGVLLGSAPTPPAFSELDYEVDSAKYLDLIQKSNVALNEEQMKVLQRNGFVIPSRSFPTFGYAYDLIYADDLPVYISADAILFSIHRSFDGILKEVELSKLIPELQMLLDAMRKQLAAGAIDELGPDATADADLYLAVALSLLEGELVPPVKNGDVKAISELFDAANRAQGPSKAALFGTPRDIDFSQFEPRGHYTDMEVLERYFRTMMWLGRIDMRLIDTASHFDRRQFDVAVGLRALMDDAGFSRYATIADVIAFFVGVPDSMTPAAMDTLYSDLGVDSLPEVTKLDDDTIADTIDEKGYGQQRIVGHIFYNDDDQNSVRLPSSFLFFGQAFVLDSYVFSQLVYDRLKAPEPRMMPAPLDIAFTVLGNNQALTLLADEIARYQYDDEMTALRAVIDKNDTTFWEASMYNQWLSMLRTLSPGVEVEAPKDHGLASVFATEAWGRRLLNTQMASWAELRHDTILYAKQSYSVGITCEFPDVYVDPYPEFFHAVAGYAQNGRRGVKDLGLPSLFQYYTRLEEVATTLEEMAQYERDGRPLTKEHLAFANDMVRIERGGICGEPPTMNGWYSELFVFANPLEYDPTIADVHTQITDESGSTVGRVMHVGTGGARVMVVVVQTEQGPRAYVGAVSSYYEVVTDNFERLTDSQWLYQVEQAADVSWMKELIVE